MTHGVKNFMEKNQIDLGFNIFSYSTLQSKTRIFDLLSTLGKEKYLKDRPLPYKKGSSKKNLIIVSDDTIKCMITLIIDFPTSSSASIEMYLNSVFGPNSHRPVSKRTVQKYLVRMNFSVKKTTFSPPNRNSIGLKIFRIAWSLFIENIFKSKDVLLGFIDESSVSASEGNLFGRAFIGLSPVIHAPLSKIKISIIALVLPGFGVLYDFVDGSIKSEYYLDFLKRSITLIHKYICNRNCEIILIEDNCKVHQSEKAENEIIKLLIALLPTVQYSPSLNGVVEGYFGIVKSNSFINSGNKSDAFIILSIKKIWKTISDDNFGLEMSQQLYYESIQRLQACKHGEPIYTGHLSIDEKIKVN